MRNGARYRNAHQRIVGLVVGMPDTMAVPSTPEWNLLELIAHLTGAATDLVSGNADDWSFPQEHRRANLDEAVT